MQKMQQLTASFYVRLAAHVSNGLQNIDVLGRLFYLGRFLGNTKPQKAVFKGSVDVLLAKGIAYIEGSLAGAGIALLVHQCPFGSGLFSGGRHSQIAVL